MTGLRCSYGNFSTRVFRPNSSAASILARGLIPIPEIRGPHPFHLLCGRVARENFDAASVLWALTWVAAELHHLRAYGVLTNP
jgi:hypothetical protein